MVNINTNSIINKFLFIIFLKLQTTPQFKVYTALLRFENLKMRCGLSGLRFMQCSCAVQLWFEIVAKSPLLLYPLYLCLYEPNMHLHITGFTLLQISLITTIRYVLILEISKVMRELAPLQYSQLRKREEWKDMQLQRQNIW